MAQGWGGYQQGDSGDAFGAGEVKDRYASIEVMPSWQLKRIADSLEQLVEIEKRKLWPASDLAEPGEPATLPSPTPEK